jgi:CRP-like cAMP-binding protein
VSDLDILVAMPLFDRVPRAALERFCQAAPRLVLSAREVAFRQGDLADRALLVVTGRLDAVLGSETLGDVRPGEIVGETALFVPDGLRQATVRAAVASTCLCLTAASLRDHRDNPAVVALQQHLIGTLGRRIRSTNLLIQKQWNLHRTPEAPPPPPTLVDRLRLMFGGGR